MWSSVDFLYVAERTETPEYTMMQISLIYASGALASVDSHWSSMDTDKLADRNPLTAIAYGPSSNSQGIDTRPYDARRATDVLRLFIDLIDVSGTDGDIWTSMSNMMAIISEYHTSTTANEVADDAFTWLIQNLGPTSRSSFEDQDLHLAMYWCLANDRTERMRCLLKASGGNVDVTECEGGYSLLHKAVLLDSSISPCSALEIGANIHLVGCDFTKSPEHETPASLALYRADTFIALKGTLRDAMVDLGDFVSLESQQSPFRGRSWTRDTLSALFYQDFDTFAFARRATDLCAFCANFTGRVMVQPSWMFALRTITRGDLSKDIRGTIDRSMSAGWQPRCVPSKVLSSRAEYGW